MMFEVRKAQSAVEFMVLIGVVLVMFLIFVGIIQGNISDEVRENRDTVAKEIALTVQNEISLAYEAPEGYFREFTLPAKVLGVDYDVDLTGTHVFVHTDDDKHAVALPTPNVTQTINPGVNIIQKVNGTVVINS